MPVGADSIAEAIRMSAEVYYELGDLLVERDGEASLNVGFEGGYAPVGITDPRDAFEVELTAIEECGCGDEFILAADVAAPHLCDEANSRYELINRQFDKDELLNFYEELTFTYPLASLEDPLDETDFDGFAELTRRLDIQIIGDDLFVTNPERLQRGFNRGTANALLLKVNQVGTVSEAFDAATAANQHGYAVQVSERSGQTADTWLADLAVGLNAGQIKTFDAKIDTIVGVAACSGESTVNAGGTKPIDVTVPEGAPLHRNF